MMRTYRYRLYPTGQQEELLRRTVETCRRLYNSLLAERGENQTNYYKQKRYLTMERRHSKYLGSVSSQVPQDVVLRLDKAYQAYYARATRRRGAADG